MPNLTCQHLGILSGHTAERNAASGRFPSACLAIFIAILLPIPSVASAKSSRRVVSVYFDAHFTKLRLVDRPPSGDSVGDEQIASGNLADHAGRTVGRFAFTCRYRKIVNGDAIERCTGWGQTRDGRLRFAGRAVKSASDHSWSLTGGTDQFAGATGTLVVHDIGDRESLATATVSLLPGRRLHAGLIIRSRANRVFVRRAERICAIANRALAELPPFPFDNFDPLRPAPSMLPPIGRFFTGPGDRRPALRARLAGLEQLGRPAGQGTVWSVYLRERTRELANIEAQDTAALQSQVPAFVQTVKRATVIYRDQAVAATEFGAYACRL
jgi:hypothetical protein